MHRIALAGLALGIIYVSAALADPPQRLRPSSTGPTVPSPHVIVRGIDQGADPSGLVRLDLLRDPPYGGQGN